MLGAMCICRGIAESSEVETGHEYVSGDMLQPREADIPALFIFLVVLPLFTYFLLGKWNESAKKKARIGILAQLSAEEAYQIEATTPVHVPLVLPPSKTGFHECARCFAPATTRCSRCKSVRYWYGFSGKCQIIHWRRAHKHDCHQWHGSSVNVSAGLILTDTVHHKSSFPGNGVKEITHCNLHNDMDDPSSVAIKTSENSEMGRKTSDKGVVNKSKGGKPTNDEIVTHACVQDYGHGSFGQASFTDHFTEISPADAPIEQKVGYGSLIATSTEVLLNKDTNNSSNVRNAMSQHNKSAGETRKGLKQKGSPESSSLFHLDRHVITEYQSGANINTEIVDTLEAGLSSANEALRDSYPDEHSTKQSMMFRKPPYTLRHSTPLMQKLPENGSREYRSQGPGRNSDKEQEIPHRIASLDNHLQDLNKNPSIEGSLAAAEKTSKMQSVCLERLGGEKEIDPRLQETTLIQQMFGGRLKSKIHGWVESLEDALTQFTAPEDLDGENMYRCGRCSTDVKARKQLSVHEVPNILTIVLKRFQTGKYGKINKCVTFPDMLDMIPFMTGTADNPPLYLLYAVVVHLDTFNASFSGHYVSYVKDLEGTWFKIDDSESESSVDAAERNLKSFANLIMETMVQPVPSSQVMSEGAYMLFYSRSFPRPPQAYTGKSLSRPPTCTWKSKKASRSGQQMQNEISCASEYSMHLGTDPVKENEDFTYQGAEYIPRPSSRNMLPNRTYLDTSSMEFSDATSSDWTLFASSDDSSFTTESTRDSFSTAPEHVHSDTIAFSKFFLGSMGCATDPPLPSRPCSRVHRARIMEWIGAYSSEHVAPAHL
ncbi:ubiquitin carboxyl-terminal hydrolase [Musa troglodytarum]|uniref:Ubiquitin carboxyl-terminal hydrolase n=1 Tax=Musa troglodytarum TaxID=320322 RepID=A0A9E7FEH1_9LILI|nr:ubiquitin carboxyl-terminal hydrolase [Musa troglodytarum]